MAAWLISGLLAVLVATSGYIRLAPSDPARWHGSPLADGPWGRITEGEGWASLRLETRAAGEVLARLDAIALATPRTRRLAGSVEEGRITWVTRSALWGFPDYTTAEARADGLYIQARQRFGRGDMGVNAERLRGWQVALAGT